MIDNRRKLQIWTSLSLSLLVLLLGVASAFVGIQVLRDSLEKQIADDNRIISETLRIIITRVSEKYTDPSSALPQIQALMETVSSRGWVGFACVLDKNGRVLAHPRQEFVDMQVPLETYEPASLLGSAPPAIDQLPEAAAGQPSIYRTSSDIIAVHWLPHLMAFLCVHQSIGGVEARIEGLRKNLLWIGLIFIAVIAGGSWTFVGRLVDRYETSVARSEARNRALVQNSSPIFVVARSGDILEANPQAESLCGRSRAELVGAKSEILWPADRSDTLSRILSETTETNVFEIDDADLRTANGQTVPVALRACAVEYGGRDAVYLLARDVAEYRRAREEILEANRRLRELDQLKSDFLNTVSHELRTPLTSIRWSTDSLAALAQEQGDETVQKLLGIIQDDNKRLSLLIEQLLSFSRVDAGELSLHPRSIQMSAFLSAAHDEVRPIAERKGVDIAAEGIPDLTFRGDPEQLRQVVVNVLDNAIKYTPEGGEVRLSAEAASVEGTSGVQINVADSGIGIP